MQIINNNNLLLLLLLIILYLNNYLKYTYVQYILLLFFNYFTIYNIVIIN